jgi:hypothetical protein
MTGIDPCIMVFNIFASYKFIFAMKKLLGMILILLSFYLTLQSQDIQSPDEFLGYPLGSQFTYHHDAVAYCKYLDRVSPMVILKEYGRTYEGRPLVVCFVSTEENLNNLENYRQSNLAHTGLISQGPAGEQIPFIWLSYNIHGNESVGMEAALKTLHALATRSYEGMDTWLEETIVIIDPCQNPDGRDLYTMRYRRNQSRFINVDAEAFEKNQGWPGARANHYLFDLNRDWTWQTQTETRTKLNLYKQYMPHVHADFHEMGSGSTYFFAPGADPWHEVITSWQRDFHKLMGDGNAALFDEKFRLYFTKDQFDLFCPSFGDTWPLFNGAMGFTYEQGGGGSAGLATVMETGDTLTLEKRIEGHFLSSLATIQVSFDNREKLILEFNAYFNKAQSDPDFEYKSIIIKGSNSISLLEQLCHLLDRNQIRYAYAGSTGKSYRGFDYTNNSEGQVTIEDGDILVSAYQPMSKLMQVLFEPDSKASDSLSYDLTGWALPYAYNLEAYAIREHIRPEEQPVVFTKTENKMPTKDPYAYLVNRSGLKELKFVAMIVQKGIRFRYAMKPFEMDGKKYNRGTIIVARGDNTHVEKMFDGTLMDAANRLGIQLHPTFTGLVSKGKDLGSGYSPLQKKPSVALIGGDGISSYSYGELWYFFEQELEFPVTLLGTDYLGSVDLTEYDVIILPSGNYNKYRDTLVAYARQGGKILAFERATSSFSSAKGTALYKSVEARKAEEKREDEKTKTDDPSLLKKYEDQRRHALSSRSASSIYKVMLDQTHPYAFGMGDAWFIIKRSTGFPYLQSGHNIGYINEKEPVSGFAGYKFQKDIQNTLVIGSERIGRGEIIYLTDSPYYRAFWKSGASLIGNMVFY